MRARCEISETVNWKCLKLIFKFLHRPRRAQTHSRTTYIVFHSIFRMFILVPFEFARSVPRPAGPDRWVWVMSFWFAARGSCENVLRSFVPSLMIFSASHFRVYVCERERGIEFREAWVLWIPIDFAVRHTHTTERPSTHTCGPGRAPILLFRIGKKLIGGLTVIRFEILRVFFPPRVEEEKIPATCTDRPGNKSPLYIRQNFY